MIPLVSVIVPVYKVEKYLERCLNSLQEQTLHDIEILLINDASPDRCGEICETYAKQDKRFRVFHRKENRGLSAARNLGIQYAVSDYLMFVDSDDWVACDFCKDAFETAKQYHADLVMFGYQHVTESGFNKLKFGSIERSTKNLMSREEAIELTFEEFGMVAWNKLYSKKLFDGIKYPEGYLFEDTGTTYKLIWKAASIYNINKVLHYYYIRPDSITKKRSTAKSLSDWFTLSLQHCNDLRKWGYSSEKLEARRTSIALSYCFKAKMGFSDSNYMIAADILKKTASFPEGISWERKFLIRLFRVTPQLFGLFSLLWKKIKVV